MAKFEILDELLQANKGYLKASDASDAGVSRAYFGEYIKNRGLERVAHGLYHSQDSWDDGMYIIQVRYPNAVFSHETALFLIGLATREPSPYSVTLQTGTNATGLTSQGVKVYKVKASLFKEGVVEVKSPAGHLLRVYNPERTLCDLIRSRRNIEIQDFQSAFHDYIRLKGKNIPLLMRYAKLFSIEKIVRQYLEVLL